MDAPLADSALGPVPSGVPVVHVEEVMGMAVSFTIRHDDGAAIRDAIGHATAWLHHVDETYSTYSDTSVITRWARGELRTDELDGEVLDVIDACEIARIDTAGAFDASMVNAPNGTRFDPSGYVKGWSAQRAMEILHRHGIRDASINAGGDIAQIGGRWRTGIRHPERSDLLAAVLEIEGTAAIATSALYERPNHIIDPTTGAAPDRLRSVTVVGPNLTTADVWATAIFVSGPDGLARLPDGYDAFLIGVDDHVLATAGMDRYRAA